MSDRWATHRANHRSRYRAHRLEKAANVVLGVGQHLAKEIYYGLGKRDYLGTPKSNEKPTHIRFTDNGDGPRKILFPKKTNMVSIARKGDNSRVFAAKKKLGSSKGVAYKKKREPKVSRKFRAKVFKAMEKDMIKGSYHVAYHGSFTAATIQNEAQHTIDAENSGGISGTYMFTASQFMNAAQVLFDNKVETFAITNWKPSAAATISFKNAKFLVKNSFVTYEIKNNTQRVMTCKAHELAPKKASCFTEENLVNTDGYVLAGTTTSVLDGLASPLNYWTRSLTQDFTNGQSYGSNGVANSTLTTKTLFLSPKTSPTFSRAFKISTQEIVLQPGQSIKLFYQGPQGLEFNAEKYWDNAVWLQLQKWCRGMLFSFNNDQVSGSLTGGGRLANASIIGEVLIERQDHFYIECPSESNNADKQDMYVRSIQPQAATGVADEIMTENPLSYAPT